MVEQHKFRHLTFLLLFVSTRRHTAAFLNPDAGNQKQRACPCDGNAAVLLAAQKVRLNMEVFTCIVFD